MDLQIGLIKLVARLGRRCGTEGVVEYDAQLYPIISFAERTSALTSFANASGWQGRTTLRSETQLQRQTPPRLFRPPVSLSLVPLPQRQTSKRISYKRAFPATPIQKSISEVGSRWRTSHVHSRLNMSHSHSVLHHSTRDSSPPNVSLHQQFYLKGPAIFSTCPRSPSP